VIWGDDVPGVCAVLAVVCRTGRGHTFVQPSEWGTRRWDRHPPDHPGERASTPLFSDSSLTPGLQIADLFAYALRVCYEQELYRARDVADLYLSAMKRFGRVVREKTIDYVSEQIDGSPSKEYGIRTMVADRFIYALGDVVNDVSPTLSDDEIGGDDPPVGASVASVE
jgi:hypothetical protein